MVAAFLQSIEKIKLLQHSGQVLPCDLNSIFNCTNVLNAWQSSVFGFPNSLMCLTFFTIFASIGLVGLSGGNLGRRLRLSIQVIALLVLGFALWFLWQSIYRIHALCILCIFCLTGLLLVNWAWLRSNANDLPIGIRGRQLVKKAIAKDIDTLAWVALASLVAFAMLLQFNR